MTKAITCTLIGRLIQEGWLRSVYDPAPAPLWRDPRAIHHLITLDHLLRMRSGLGFPVWHGDGGATLGFENSAVYQDAGDAFEAAQRSIVATVPGSVYRYINSGLNVLGAIIRDRIERRGLPYHETLYGLLADRTARHGELSAFRRHRRQSDRVRRRLRDIARLRQARGAVSAGRHVGRRAAAAAGLGRLRADPDAYRHQLRGVLPDQSRPAFPDLPPDTAWASGASDQRIFILRRHRLTVAVNNETDHPMDLAALNRVIATAVATWA